MYRALMTLLSTGEFGSELPEACVTPVFHVPPAIGSMSVVEAVLETTRRTAANAR